MKKEEILIIPYLYDGNFKNGITINPGAAGISGRSRDVTLDATINGTGESGWL